MHIGVRRIPLLPPAGLGQLAPAEPMPAPAPATVPTDPLWARLGAAFGTPLVQGVSTRIAYGGGAYPPGGGWFYPYGSGGGSFGFGGMSQSTLMLVALAIGAVLIFRK